MKTMHKLLIAIFFLFNYNFYIQAQVAVDNVSTFSEESTPITFSHTVSGTNRFLIVGISLESGASDKRVTNVTYGGIGLTRVGESVCSGGDPRADVWSLLNPPTGSNNVTVTLQQDNKCRIGAISFTNVKQSGPIGGIVEDEGSTGNPSMVVVSNSDYLVMDVVASLASTLTVGAGQTSRWTGDMGGSGKRAGGSTEPGASSVTMSWTGSEKWAGVAFNLIPEPLVPVELTYFTASVIKDCITLNWKTAAEVNNYGFEIERSDNKLSWNTIAFVNGYGHSNSPKEYEFLDKEISTGSFYYRLKQIDSDGGFSYSNAVSVSIDQLPTSFALYQNYPNPFNPTTTIKYAIAEESFVTLKIYNIIGSEIMTLVDEKLSAGIYEYSFDASMLPSGAYIYKIQASNFTEIRKMILSK